MRVHRRLVAAERGAEREHPVRRVEQVLTSDHVRDRHVEVVDGVGQEEEGRAVGTHDHEVVDEGPLDRDGAADQILEGTHAVVGRAESDRARPPLGRTRGALRGREVAAVTVVPGWAAGGASCLVALPQLVLRARALVRVPGRDEILGGGEVPVEARALQHRPLVPVEAEPRQRLLDAHHPLVPAAGDVGVLDPQDEHTTVVTREQPVEQRGAGPAHVERAGRRRREPDARGGEARGRHQAGTACISSERHSAMSVATCGGVRSTASGTASTMARRRA